MDSLRDDGPVSEMDGERRQVRQRPRGRTLRRRPERLHVRRAPLRATAGPALSVQYHPEAAPGPQDSHYLFSRFTGLMGEAKG